MKLISHRGNLNGSNTIRENSPHYIMEAIACNYDVEIDIWVINNNLFLGHDAPQYLITLNWLINLKESLWIHTKNFEALNYLINKPLRIFYHEQERQTIINNCNLIWSHDLSKINDKSIIPLLDLEDAKNFKQYKTVFGICSDYIKHIKDNI